MIPTSEVETLLTTSGCTGFPVSAFLSVANGVVVWKDGRVKTHGWIGLLWALAMSSWPGMAEEADRVVPELRVASFMIDATPPIGSPLAYDEMTWVDKPLSCRGVVIWGAGRPIVLAAVDWIGIANGGQDAWKEALAEGGRTFPERVSVHTLHQHDAPVCDFTANQILNRHGWGGILFNPAFARETLARAAEAVQRAKSEAQPFTHIGLGSAIVHEVASNRRILGPDGKVIAMRWTSCTDPELRALPAGTVDPRLRLVSFWNEDQPLVVLTYFATHPQSYYRTGGANPDFPGLAREWRETATGGIPHIHFDGAGGNIGAGKWNDGSKEMRRVLAERLARGMEEAWNRVERIPVSPGEVSWKVEKVRLPPSPHLDAEALQEKLAARPASPTELKEAAAHLTWLQRCREGQTIDVGCLALGPARIVHLPGEAVVEYQLAAQAMRPEQFVAVAAYGDYGPGYICLRKHYREGGYEASPRASRVDPSVEEVLMTTLRHLLLPHTGN